MAFLCTMGGCAATVATTESGIPGWTITRQVGGVNDHLLVNQGFWYQTRRDLMLVLDPADGHVIREVRFGEEGTVGAATDLLLSGDDLYVILEHDGVAQLDVGDPSNPKLTRIVSARELDLQPRRLSRVDDELYISGEGGIVRLSDRQRVFTNVGEVGPVLRAADGLVTTVGRRAYRLADQEYVGSASLLEPLPEGYGIPGHLVFARRGDDADQFGLMSSSIREINANEATFQLDSHVRRIRFLNDLIWVVTGRGLLAYRLEVDRLRLLHSIEMEGLNDVADAGENLIALCGAFGRGLFRPEDDGRNPGQVFLWREDAPGPLVAVQSDGTSILADDGARQWLFDATSGELQPSGTSQAMRAGDQRRAVTLGAEARIEDEGRSLMMSTAAGPVRHVEPQRERIRCVVAVRGRFWIGHDRGVTILDPGDPQHLIRASLRLPGPVIHLMPLLNGEGAAYATETGGFGVIANGSDHAPLIVDLSFQGK